MGGITPVWAIPYPTGTDRVADGDNAMEALAAKVDALLGAKVYTGVAMGAGWTGAVAFIVRSGWVHVRLAGQNPTGWPNNAIVATLPVGARPSSDVWTFGVLADVPMTPTAVRVAPAGSIIIAKTQTGNAGIDASFAYPAMA